MPQTRNAIMNTLTRWTPQLDDRLCELVETDQHSFGEIARIMGLGRNQVTARWRRIVTRMGTQAV